MDCFRWGLLNDLDDADTHEEMALHVYVFLPARLNSQSCDSTNEPYNILWKAKLVHIK